MGFFFAKEEEEGLLEVDAWQTLWWKDSRLSWNAGQYGNVTSISLPVTKLWTPDVVQVDGFVLFPWLQYCLIVKSLQILTSKVFVSFVST